MFGAPEPSWVPAEGVSVLDEHLGVVVGDLEHEALRGVRGLLALFRNGGG